MFYNTSENYKLLPCESQKYLCLQYITVIMIKVSLHQNITK